MQNVIRHQIVSVLLVADLYRSKYHGANFKHYTELLAKYEGILVSPTSVSNILEEVYILSPKVTKAKKRRISKKKIAKSP